MESVLWSCTLIFVGVVAVVNGQCISTNLLFRVRATPANSIVRALNDVTLTCSRFSGTTPNGYSWHRVNGDIPSHSSGQNTNRLTIHRAVPADEGQYYCMGTFFGHCGVSNNVMVIVESFVNITSVIPNNLLIAEGGTAQFNITAFSIGELSYQWKKRNVNRLPEKVLDEDTPVLRIPNLDKSDEGLYYCIVTNMLNISEESINITLTVYGPPSITTHPSSQLITGNMNITLDCEETGRGSITYQWETRNINGGQWMDISNSNNRRLVVGTLEQSQQYRCVVSNEAGSTRSNVATITVLKITTHPQNEVLAVNSVINFICTSSVSSNVIFSWTHNGTSISGWLTTGGTSILTITRVRHSDAGSFVCTVRSGSLSVMSNAATLTIYGPPVVINQPSSNDIPVGRSIILTCRANSLGTIIYSWERSSGSSWTTVSNDNTTSYTTDTTLAIGQYIYRCRVSNEAGSVVSNIATVNVYGPPTITYHPVNNNDIPVGRTVTLMCGASGLGTLVYSWERSSGSSWTTVSNDNTTSYTTDTTLAIGQYMYRCRVSNEAGSVVSNIATVNVYGPPTITTHPSSQLINISISVILDCEGTGRGSITYQWETSNINGGQWMNISNSNSRTVVVGTLEQSQQYRCVVSNEAGSTRSNVATVTVLKISTHPVSHTEVVALEEVILHCSASVDDVMYSWHCVDGDLPSGSTGRHTDTLTIHRATPHDEGMYYCTARKSGIRVNSGNASIEVDDQLGITVVPSDLLIGKGTTAQFTAIATGISTNENNFIYQWRKRDSGSLPNKVLGVNGEILTIPNVLESDEGQYYCIVTNEWNRNVESDEVTLAVFGPPVILIHPIGDDVPINRNIALTCRASGLGTLVYSWERSSGSSWTTVSNDNTTSYTTDTTLAIGQYMYRCRVSNEAGSVVSNIATVNVYGPPTITTHPTNELTNISISVILKCRGTGLGSITYHWETSNINGRQWMNVSNNRRLVVRTLEQSQRYRCVVSNEAGSTRSNVATVTVLKIITQPISSVTVVALEDVTLTCLASVDNVAYSWHRVGDGVPSRSQGQSSSTFTIHRITPYDDGMYYCVATKNNITVESNRATVRVDDQLTISVIPSSSEIDERETAQFSAIADGVNKINFMYQWRKRGSDFLPNKLLSVNETVFTIPDLGISDQGNYYCIVTNEWDRSIVSDDVTLIVKAIPPPPPQGFRITDIHIYTFQLTWTVIMNFHDNIDHYAVHYNLTELSEKTIKLTSFSGTYTLDNLRPYTVYSVYVTAVRSIGNTGRLLAGMKSTTITERTFAGEPMITNPMPGLQTIVINDIEPLTINTTKILLPVIGTENGPFSHLYIVVINDDVLSNSERTVSNVEDITTQELLEESTKASPSYYIAAVINASQYVDGNRMAYILRAEDYTTDAYGHVFYNRQLRDNNFKYFFRVFSISSTQENEISTTTNPEGVPSENSSNNQSGATVVVGVVVVLVIIIIIIVLFIICLVCYRKGCLKHPSQFKHSSDFTSGNKKSIKEKVMIVEEKIAESVLAEQMDKPVTRKIAYLESTVVNTSVNQPTTLIVKLTDNYKVEVIWKKDRQPVNHPVLPDGSLYIVNTSLSDSGEYSVIVTKNKRTTVENLQLTVFDPKLLPENSGHEAIKVKDFAEHVASLDTESKFVEEFATLVIDAPFTQHAAKLLCNKAKHRYDNIIPYDHSRVVLTQQNKLTGSDYINASHIDGFEETRAYISTQGPMYNTVDDNTVDDYWRMIWEHQVATIVMLTRIKEDDKVKCHQYWPNSGFCIYGNIKVTLHKEEQLTNYCLRQFVVEQACGVEDQTHLIYQFHFTAWPDHDVLKHPTALLEFHKKVDTHHMHRNNKPMLVHCSAGVGRSGIFIAIDSEIQRMKKKGVIDVYNCVRKMRFQRNFMVQTVSQYSFIHLALLEHTTGGVTSISAPIDNVKEIVDELSTINPETNKTGFQQQFENLEKNCSKEQDFNCTFAALAKNRHKNRYQKFLPPDSARVIIPQLDGNSYYINFCYIDDYDRGKAFLAGPGPMHSTGSDFWTMMWENKSYVIVMLGHLKENKEEVCYKYWPDKSKTVKFGKFSVETTVDNAWGKGLVKRIFKVTDTEQNDTKTITQLQYTEWSQKTCPDNYTSLLNLISMVESIQRVTNNGPITVHCSDGVGRSGTFCAIMISVNQFKAEQKVDIFQIIKIIRTQRPGSVTNADQFKFIHDALVAMLKQYGPYNNFINETTF